MKKTIHIYHTNDLHSHFENWPRIEHFLKERRSLHEEAGEYSFAFDIGDHVDRAHPLTEGTLGSFNIELLNESRFDAVAIGNNEGITMPKEALNRLYDHASFPVICANLFEKNGETRPDWIVPHAFFQAGSTTIAVTSATAQYNAFYELLDWCVTIPIDELKKQISMLKKRADIVIVLSHLGMYDDEKLAEETEADVILGGHTHHVFHEGKTVNGTLLAAAGKYGYFAGHVEIDLDADSGQILAKRARVFETNRSLKPPPDEQEQKAMFESRGKKVLSIPVVQLERELSNDWFEPSPLPQMLTEALTEWCQADCAFLNAGVVLGHLPAGEVTKYDLHKLLPHPINPCLIELTGAELSEVLRQTCDEKWPHLQIKGLGFRGSIMGRFIYDRIEMKGTHFLINGQPINMKKTYKLATLDMFTYGHYFVELHRAPVKTYFMPEFLRDVLEWKLLKL
ncbi:bifunctional metallophosphatase/5'-nucleotidase [Domibacillus iocasae]|uniref:Bifunctional metallophosphatase/5'-nucleotidase n=1 Tax=Domibacillus iocasae TaxID=1714016 RepID=A0A1E7DTX2_9BACI|nr:bifunctional UDP-sugar hydrolase/5'-nucleotidase [Domibacillus iocasae]OES46537.1 bifunctional metallophosphatase/5'-nucleotidase [Domibacillus iocasae]